MPFGDYENFDACVAANQDKDNPEGFCAALHKKITGEWPSENRFAESFEWTANIEKFGPLLRGKAIHPVKTYHPDEWPHIRIFLEEELQKSADSLVGKHLFLDHWYQFPGSQILAAQYNDGALEYVADPGREAERVFGLVQKGDIKHASVQFEWKILEQVNGIAPRGINYQHLSLLKDMPPGDPQSSVEIWEAIIKEAKSRQPNPTMGNLTISSSNQYGILLGSESGGNKMSLEEQRGKYQNLIDTWGEWAGSYTKCVEVLSGKEDIENPDALCAWLHHEAEGKWPAEESAIKAITKILMERTPKTPPVLKEQEPPAAGEPKTDRERFIAHFGVSEEYMDGLLEKFGEAIYKLLPERGTKVAERIKVKLKEQEQELTVEEIKAKIEELSTKRSDIEKQIYPEAELTPEQRDELQKQLDVIWSELQGYEQALAAKIAGQAETIKKLKGDIQKLKEQDEPEKDEHGCIVGEEQWDEEVGECVPIPPAELEEARQEIEALKGQIQVLTEQKKALEEELKQAKKAREAIISSSVTPPPDMISKTEVVKRLKEAVFERVPRHWGYGPLEQNRRIKKLIQELQSSS